MSDRVDVAGLAVAEPLYRFVEDEALPGTGVESKRFWQGLADLVADSRIPELLTRRDELQTSVDEFHRAHPGRPDPHAYHEFLRGIGYLVDEPEPFEITTSGVDPEVALVAGPQLVVPLLNARFATNAVNARWGSLYDAMYGTDVVPAAGDLAPGPSYNEVRGAEVVRRVRAILDDHVPADGVSHAEVTAYRVDAEGLILEQHDGRVARLRDPHQLVGHRGDAGAPDAVVLVHHGLHLEIQVDRDHPVGRADRAGVSDVLLEAALTTIMDLEDSVAAVDAEDKVLGYRNWLRLMQGTLAEEVTKGGETFTRRMNPDRELIGRDGEPTTLRGRSLLFLRHVGHLMTTDAVLDGHGRPVPEGILDALVTALAGLHDLRAGGGATNSPAGSMYFVKPKLHGPDEVAAAVAVFARVEEILGLVTGTIKLGLMDEERRTSVNLAACVHAARERIAFVNTGFLDRTGDEIHTSMLAGPMVRKADMKQQPWIRAYENSNVEIALACGFRGRAQIGKGMWAAPDSMAEMVEQKIGHPEAGASTAWVPSPTAATLHALHYHRVDVAARQAEIAAAPRRDHLPALLTLPLGNPTDWSEEERQQEIDNNLQGALGYVVRWVDAGIGCSKVPDIHGTPLMEDRATCRISSQHVANWLLHGVVTREQVEDRLRAMAEVVDGQNADLPGYLPMAPAFDGDAFRAVRALVLDGVRQPSGYTEPLLHAHRLARKASDRS